MRVALYNQHWPTLGGGEQLAAALAVALAREHDVELLVGEEFDADEASERLGIDVRGLRQHVVESGTRAFLEATEAYDLVVNTSFSNTFSNRARHGWYYVHFPRPHPPTDRRTRLLQAWIGDRLGAWSGGIEFAQGFWMPEFPRGGRWTQDRARIDLIVPRGVRLRFGFDLVARYWPRGSTPEVTVHLDGTELFAGRVRPEDPARIRGALTGEGLDRPHALEIRSDTFVPRLAMGYEDDRELGIVVSGAFLGPRQLWVPRRLRPDLPGRFSAEFLAGYDLVLANSAYTAHWVRRFWGRTAEVLTPPVRPRAVGVKEPIILSVGRFFPSASGHSKKQLELVQAFRVACARGLSGWELCLVGGCSEVERGYLDDVRRAAAGLPVRFYVNASGEDVDDLFARASLFWHGAGLGEDPERSPDRFEHFGISVLEAMTAGAVPIVFARGGPAAIVCPGRTGLHFRSLSELADQTVALARDETRRAAYARAAMEDAAEYSFDHFADRTLALVGELDHVSVPRSARSAR